MKLLLVSADTGTPVESNRVARQMASLLLRQQPSEQSSETYRAAAVTIHAPAPLALQVDGSDLTQNGENGATDYSFSVIPGGLMVLLPRTYDGEMFAHGMEPYSAVKTKGKKKKGKKA